MATASQPITWKMVAKYYPEFVQWAVQTQGPLPEVCTMEEYDRLSTLYADTVHQAVVDGEL